MRRALLLPMLLLLLVGPPIASAQTCVTRSFTLDDPTGASGGANVFRLQSFFTDELNLFNIPNPAPWAETVATTIRIRVGQHTTNNTTFRYGLMNSMALLTPLYTSPNIVLAGGTYTVTNGQTTGGLSDERSLNLSGAGVFFLEYVGGSTYFLGQMEVVLCRVGGDDEPAVTVPNIELDVTPLFTSMNGYIPIFLGIFALPGGIVVAIALVRMLINAVVRAFKSVTGK